MQLLMAIKHRQATVNIRVRGAHSKAAASLLVKDYSVLFALRTIVMQPAEIKAKPGRSYFHINDSPSTKIANNIATKIPKHAPPATSVRSKNGSTDKWTIAPMIINVMPQTQRFEQYPLG